MGWGVSLAAENPRDSPINWYSCEARGPGISEAWGGVTVNLYLFRCLGTPF